MAGMTHGSRIAIGLVSAVIVLVLFATYSGRERPASAQEASASQTVDFRRPVFTREGAVVCPVSLLTDKRVGHGLKDASDAAVALFGQAKAVEALGCSIWRDGIKLQVPEDSPPENAWVLAGEPNSRYISAFLVFGRHLRN